MGNILDTILLEDLITSPTTVNTDFVSESINLTYREAEFAIQLDYDNGSAVNMSLSLEVSNDDISFVPVTDSAQLITDADGTHIWSIGGEGASFLRVAVTVTAGSIDIQKLLYRAKRRH